MDYSWLIVPLLVAAVVGALIALALRARRQRVQRQILGLSWLQCMRAMLAHIQQHRGLSTAWLNGRRELLADIENLQRQISRDIVEVARMHGWMEAQESWQGLTQHWARLAGGFRDNNVDNNIVQHNALVLSLLHLIDDMAQAHDLLLLRCGANKPFELSWRELLTAAEFIGQTRAVGMGITALGRCDSIARIRLNYLCLKITDNTARVWRDIPPAPDQQRLVGELITCVNEQVVRDHVTIQPAEFFAVASAALDSLHDQYDRLVEEQRWRLKG